MKPQLLICLLIVGCANANTENTNKVRFTKWARNLIDCPTAEVSLTGSRISSQNDKLSWNSVDTFYIIGCGLKICCSYHDGSRNCFPCRKEGWY